MNMAGDDMASTSPVADEGVRVVADTLTTADPSGARTAAVLRETYDQLYDGQRTGRYRWEDLYKTEKTHFGTLIEINLRREFADVIGDGDLLDYAIGGHEVDCKYAHQPGGWMLPPECFGKLLLVCTASDQRSEWSMGVVRASDANRRTSSNRDGKTGLNEAGRRSIHWLHQHAELPPNVLLHLGETDLTAIFDPSSGQQRVNELFRRAVGRRVSRTAVATVAMQKDPVKRVRENGGARTTLAPEGILIPGGDYEVHRQVAVALGVPVPDPGEFISIAVVPAHVSDPHTVVLDGQRWRAARPGENPLRPAPLLPRTKKSS